MNFAVKEYIDEKKIGIINHYHLVFIALTNGLAKYKK